MISMGVIHELTLRLLEVSATALLRAIGGPVNLPKSNLDLVWF